MVCLQLAELKEEAHKLEMMFKSHVSHHSNLLAFPLAAVFHQIVLILSADYKFLPDMNKGP